jgi:hypothetical protein
MIAGIDTMGCCDPTGGIIRHFRAVGLSELPFVSSVIVLWILLGFLLIPPVVRRTYSGHAAWWESFGAFVFFPLSLFSILYAISLFDRYHGWAIAMPILLPPLIGLYGIWARFPAMHRADVTNAVVWGAIYVLALAPFPLSFLDARTYPERLPDRTRDFRRLTPDSTLRDYLDFRPHEPRREDWFEGVRRVKSRQTDAVMLLKENPKLPYRQVQLEELSARLWDLDLEATPSLCEAFHEQLRKKAAKIKPSGGPGDESATGTAIDDVWYQLTTIKWLAGANCDLSDTLIDIETKLRTVPPRPPGVIVTISPIPSTLSQRCARRISNFRSPSVCDPTRRGTPASRLLASRRCRTEIHRCPATREIQGPRTTELRAALRPASLTVTDPPILAV